MRIPVQTMTGTKARTISPRRQSVNSNIAGAVRNMTIPLNDPMKPYAEKESDRLNVDGGPGHQVTGLPTVVEARAKELEFMKVLSAQVIRDPVAYHLPQVDGRVDEAQTDCACQENQPADQEQLHAATSGEGLVYSGAEEPWNRDVRQTRQRIRQRGDGE